MDINLFMHRIVPAPIIKEYKRYKKRRNSKSYQGDKVYCPICKSKFEIFAPSGSLVARNNAVCLNCDSSERLRLIFLYLTNKTNLFDKETKIRLLHFAPEKSFYDFFSQNDNIEYYPCDLFPEMYKSTEQKVKILKNDITNISFDDSYFDVILCNHVLEHVPDDRQAMSELYRVMKKGGWGIFQVPIDNNMEKTFEDFTITKPKEREKAFGQSDHVRCYGNDYLERLKNAGFEVEESDYISGFSPDEMFKYGITPNELIYHCRK